MNVADQPTLWHPCLQGYPDPEHCPDCTPPEDDRCPDRDPVNGAPCRVLGEHHYHQDGRGMSWWFMKDDDNDTNDEAST